MWNTKIFVKNKQTVKRKNSNLTNLQATYIWLNNDIPGLVLSVFVTMPRFHFCSNMNMDSLLKKTGKNGFQKCTHRRIWRGPTTMRSLELLDSSCFLIVFDHFQPHPLACRITKVTNQTNAQKGRLNFNHFTKSIALHHVLQTKSRK